MQFAENCVGVAGVEVGGVLINNRGVEREDDLAKFEVPTGIKPFVWRYLRGGVNFIGAMGIAAATLGHARFKAPFEVTYPEIPLPLANLPGPFEGFRIAQLSDLHAVRATPLGYIRRVVERVNELRCDIACITGDLVSSRVKDIRPVCDVLARLRMPGYVTFGNHDYSHTGDPWVSGEVADALEVELRKLPNVTVLRNQAVPVERGGSRIWLVGLEDFWSLKFDADRAFQAVNGNGEAVIALSHNPDTIYALARHRPQWVLAGHTHAGQINVPVMGALVLPMRHKQFVYGHFRVQDTRMYVTSGIGFKIKARFRCPPEVPIFTLRREDGR